HRPGRSLCRLEQALFLFGSQDARATVALLQSLYRPALDSDRVAFHNVVPNGPIKDGRDGCNVTIYGGRGSLLLRRLDAAWMGVKSNRIFKRDLACVYVGRRNR